MLCPFNFPVKGMVCQEKRMVQIRTAVLLGPLLGVSVALFHESILKQSV